jgi:hypothetical protein
MEKTTIFILKILVGDIGKKYLVSLASHYNRDYAQAMKILC